MRVWTCENDANLKSEIVEQIQRLGKKYDLSKIVLFGSRATKKNWERSDIDLMISEKDIRIKQDFQDALEDIQTLLIFDVVNECAYNFSNTLAKEIERDGVILYEKV